MGRVIMASGTISTDTILIVLVSVGTLLLTGIAWLAKAGIGSVLKMIAQTEAESKERDKENLKVTQEVHDKVDSHGQRIAYIEGKEGLPLGTIPRENKG